MRLATFLGLCCALLATLVVAQPQPRAPPLLQNRRVVPFGSDSPTNLQRDRGTPLQPKVADEGSSNYLVTLDRFISDRAKDAVLDKLMGLGVVVKTAFDYRVYKGYLVSVPSNKRLADWQASVLTLPGVKYIEVDQAVK
ncbi:hypothetical protein DMC30DRAFT_343015, partial [Rhodotorula diobovata]